MSLTYWCIFTLFSWNEKRNVVFCVDEWDDRWLVGRFRGLSWGLVYSSGLTGPVQLQPVEVLVLVLSGSYLLQILAPYFGPKFVPTKNQTNEILIKSSSLWQWQPNSRDLAKTVQCWHLWEVGRLSCHSLVTCQNIFRWSDRLFRFKGRIGNLVTR